MKIVKHEKKESEGMLYEDLDEGACFKTADSSSSVWMKTDYEQDAVDLMDGQYVMDLCGTEVYPINAEVHIFDS